MAQIVVSFIIVGQPSIVDLIDRQVAIEHTLWTDYRTQYGFTDYAQRHRIEPLTWRDLRLVGQRFDPVGSARGVIHVVHGYQDHTGTQEPLIRHLTQSGWTVRSIDLPGHGVSQGARSDITSMSDYSSVLSQWLGGQTKPLRIIGHSMGGAVIIEGMRSGLIHPSDRVVLIAPLVRWRAWRLSAIGQFLLGWMIDSVPRGQKHTSHDVEFQNRRLSDPLRFERIPLNWVRSMRRWSNQFEQQTALRHRPTIVQGRRDRVVDWRANHRLIQRVFPQAAFHFFNNGRHHLYGETPTIRQRVMTITLERLKME